MKKSILLLFSAFIFSMLSCIREDDTPVIIPPSTGGVMQPAVGGAAEPNQVWVNLSTNEQKVTPRTSWDLAFYCGEDFKVILNYSLMMSATRISGATDISAVTEQSVAALKPLVQVANFEDNAQYIDFPGGGLGAYKVLGTVSTDNSQNGVYLVNMGFDVYKGDTTAGTVYSAGDARGWMKIRILRDAEGYKIQYAPVNSKEYKEFSITKDPDYNFKYFSFTTGNYADVEPKKKNWDICFTVFTNLVDLPGTNSKTSYIYADSVLHNILADTGVYEVATPSGQGEAKYNEFKKEDVEASKFVFSDRRTIGANWRTTTGPNGAEVYSNKFYVLKNSEGLYFKLRFLRMKDDKNFRGFPQFEYKPL